MRRIIGEFQRDRVDEVGGEGGGFWEWQEDGSVDDEEEGGEGDEYAEARKARSLVNKVKQAEKMRKAGERKKKKAEGLL